VLTALLFVLAACNANQETATPEVAISVPEASSDSVEGSLCSSKQNTQREVERPNCEGSGSR